VQDTFDPYYKWLGIRAEQQPPTLYRLLGVNEFEKDVDAIHSAADSRSGYLRTLQSGPHGEAATRLLNEVGRARIVLTNPNRRAAYDCVLHSAKPADGRADIYSLGCTRHFLLTGRPPYPGKSLMDKLAAHRTQPIPSLRAARPEVPEHVDAAFQKMLAKDVAGRFQFMSEVADAVEPPSAQGFWKKFVGSWKKLWGRRAG
jgi:serine/threonine protein kinase